MANKYSKTPCNIKMTLMSKDVNIEKFCTNLWDVYTFERDMPTKHGLQFSGKPYIIGKVYLDAIAVTGGSVNMKTANSHDEMNEILDQYENEMNGNTTIKSAINRACEINKWVAPKRELEALIRICNKQQRLNDADLGKMINWFINDKFNEHNSLETTLTDFYNYLNAQPE